MVKPAGCVFCPVPGEKKPGQRALPVWEHVTSHVTRYASDALPTAGVIAVFEPLNPVVPGHLLVVPEKHVRDAGDDPTVAAACMDVAATIAKRYKAYNLITSAGAPATQTVRHLHVHVVPRRDGDGLPLPWTPQQAASKPLACPCGGVLPCLHDTVTGPWCPTCDTHHPRAHQPRRPVGRDDIAFDAPEPEPAPPVAPPVAAPRFTTGVPIGGPR